MIREKKSKPERSMESGTEPLQRRVSFLLLLEQLVSVLVLIATTTPRLLSELLLEGRDPL